MSPLVGTDGVLARSLKTHLDLMSQKNVEIIIGKLVTDEEFQLAFRRDAEAALDELGRRGLELTPVERVALLSLDLARCRALSNTLDPRLQKSCLHDLDPLSGEGSGS